MMRLLLRLALLAYPRAFRHRFGAEMRRDFERSTTGSLGTLGTIAANGFAERWSAFVRTAFPR